MARKRKSNTSTLNPWLRGTQVRKKRVTTVVAAPKRRVTRDVAFTQGGPKRIPVPELQDWLLIRKGYLPKYSGRPLEYFAKRGTVTIDKLEDRERLWQSGHNI